ncbi:MAG: tRNA 4-thiouridine(8) synthase ThiI [Thermofilaceae archaeon]|nr:tRNA 4-thiouridine(8) synthase ThiI [Thermofilaceae archaeon]
MVVLLRLGELTIKSSRSRRRFEKMLMRNIEDAMRSCRLDYSARLEGGRIFIYTSDENKAADTLRRVFGIKSLSIAQEVSYTDLEDLIAKAEEYFLEKIKGRRFAVRARRAGRVEFTSIDVERALGAKLLKYALRVDLENPEVTAYVEVRGSRAYLFTNILKAYGGLPIGSEGKAVALVSGGFDSAVAAWFTLKRGVEVHYVLCNLGGPVQEAGTLHVLRVLAERWSYGYRPRLYVVDFSEVLKDIRRKCDPSLSTLVLKRYMYRVAEAIAEKEAAEAIITGDSIGQAASQTLSNLQVSSAAVKTQILRPLIGFDKDDIIAIAREIGTYEASMRVREYCGAFSERPRIRAKLSEVEKEENKLEESIVNKIMDKIKIYDLKNITLEENIEDLEIDNIPKEALVVDLRSEEKFKSWSLPGSIRIDFDKLLEGSFALDPNKPYVFVCEEGALSMEAAYILRKIGVRAYSLKGGVRRLRRKLSS